MTNEEARQLKDGLTEAFMLSVKHVKWQERNGFFSPSAAIAVAENAKALLKLDERYEL